MNQPFRSLAGQKSLLLSKNTCQVPGKVLVGAMMAWAPYWGPLL